MISVLYILAVNCTAPRKNESAIALSPSKLTKSAAACVYHFKEPRSRLSPKIRFYWFWYDENAVIMEMRNRLPPFRWSSSWKYYALVVLYLEAGAIFFTPFDKLLNDAHDFVGRRLRAEGHSPLYQAWPRFKFGFFLPTRRVSSAFHLLSNCIKCNKVALIGCILQSERHQSLHSSQLDQIRDCDLYRITTDIIGVRSLQHTTTSIVVIQN